MRSFSKFQEAAIVRLGGGLNDFSFMFHYYLTDFFAILLKDVVKPPLSVYITLFLLTACALFTAICLFESSIFKTLPLLTSRHLSSALPLFDVLSLLKALSPFRVLSFSFKSRFQSLSV